MRLKSPSTNDAPASPAEKPTSYRTVGSLGTGALLVVFGAIFLFAFSLGSEKHPIGATLGLLMIVGGTIGGLYPAAFSYPDHLLIRNPFRRIEVAWPRVDSVTARLSTVVQTVPEEGKARKFTIWSIPVSMHERRKSDRAASKKIRQIKSEAAKQATSAGDIAGGALGAAGYGRPRAMRQDPLETMAFADQAVVEMRDRQRACSTSVEKAAGTTVTWTWYTVGPFVVAAVLVVLAGVGVF
ncbi:PH domain-containing protein [Catenulispora yoronensis]|uniref:PH domain-containing protein n=1 Tax=Catenulispora yoronensis TaxID=450799 RepID=A0ABN2VGZ4_9ACTN